MCFFVIDPFCQHPILTHLSYSANAATCIQGDSPMIVEVKTKCLRKYVLSYSHTYLRHPVFNSSQDYFCPRIF